MDDEDIKEKAKELDKVIEESLIKALEKVVSPLNVDTIIKSMKLCVFLQNLINTTQYVEARIVPERTDLHNGILTMDFNVYSKILKFEMPIPKKYLEDLEN
ncbi:hypothetical protein [Cognatishimia sp.]|uniref:hypothetical protein n=1 Tax=Cognatishimia sp. TaxID=2211648 RepID=UPI00351673C4|nr:hypothetical protein [Cognatishimia sp.]